MHENEFQGDGLRVFSPTDRRDYDDWAYDQEFCKRFLLSVAENHPAPVWRVAIERYWRDRCSRRELASELGIGLEAVKSLVSTIRKAASEFKNDGAPAPIIENNEGTHSGWCHTTITRTDVEDFANGEPDTVAFVNEYRRLTVIALLKHFSEKISGELIKLLDTTTDEARLVSRADELKAAVVRDDPFAGRCMVIGPDQRSSIGIDVREMKLDPSFTSTNKVVPFRVPGNATDEPVNEEKGLCIAAK